MFQSENAMIVDDALQRIDSIMKIEPLPEVREPASLRDASVEIQDVSFRYDDEKEALHHVFMHIDSGRNRCIGGAFWRRKKQRWQTLFPVFLM